MSIFDRFRRNKQSSVLPEEVQQYYQTEQRQRRGVAALIAVGALLVTIAIAAALFFGVRFAYHQIRGDDDKKTQTTNTQDGWQNPDKDKTNDQQKPTDNQSQATPTPTPAPATTPTPTPSPAPATTPSLGDTQALPHTGDEGM